LGKINPLFDGIGQTLNQFEIRSSYSNPLVGQDVKFATKEVRPFGKALIWDVIPGEYFFTRETEPQVIVQVDDMPALCTGLNCGFTYFVGESAIDGFSIAGNRLTISGRNFDTPLKVEMGHIACSNIEHNASRITCDLAGKIPAGSWWPRVIEANGKVQVDSSVSAKVVPMVISNVTPKIDLNPAGGDLMVITGNNFPPTLDSRYNFSI
jgi:hypothetical protein